MFVAGRGEMLSASAGGRVVEVDFRQGDRVARARSWSGWGPSGSTTRSPSSGETIRAAEEELARIDRLGALLEAPVRRDPVEGRGGGRPGAGGSPPGEGTAGTVDVRLAEVALKAAKDEESAIRRLVGMRAASHRELLKATTAAREAEGKLARARLPVNEERMAVAQRAARAGGAGLRREAARNWS